MSEEVSLPKKRENLKGKDDFYLVEAIKGEDPQDRELAMAELWSRHAADIHKYLSQRLPSDWVEDVEQDTWLAFWQSVTPARIRETPRALLFGIAHNKMADEYVKREAERRIEKDIPAPEYSGPEELLKAELSHEEMIRLPFIAPLAHCQRVIWILRMQYDFSRSVVARLMAKKEQTVSSNLNHAKKKVEQYIRSEEYDILNAFQEFQDRTYFPMFQEPAFVIERFQERVSCQITPEEVAHLGWDLTPEEFQSYYQCSFILPGPGDKSQLLEQRYFYLLLTRSEEWEDLQAIHRQLPLDPKNVDQPDFVGYFHHGSEEYAIRVEIDGDDMILTPEEVIRTSPVYTGDRLFASDKYYAIHFTSRPLMLPMDNLGLGKLL